MNRPNDNDPNFCNAMVAYLLPMTERLPDVLLEQFADSEGHVPTVRAILAEAISFQHKLQSVNILAGDTPNTVFLKVEEQLGTIVRTLEWVLAESEAEGDSETYPEADC